MKTKTLLASLAVAGLVVAQPVSAATRSAASQDTVERIGSPAGESENLRGKPILVILLVALIVAGLIVVLSDGNEPASP